ncbi:NADPH-dependent FMN reductase [Streptomyces sp. H10-C2]|uniref:NADPH-dependent FMN reductase n=1 Tax=unclassified Streptomyces TaxID=2593676 RepID=UPI0024BB0A4A|nr:MULTISPECIES: NADPH-dependent FMN reductase [unclassified Streptomyces]MDJ0342106.1 NADPH-dependent FMN reductase [Streptomyces sp. PH10-H1]MDJ0368448.1 NADPH-dependent FMN reductase [Streptomyces sp. H10-C2]
MSGTRLSGTRLSGTRLLAVSGSLRAASSNSTLLRALLGLVPPGTTTAVYDALAGLPHFNPDMDREGMSSPPPVAELRAAVGSAGAVLIVSPEYAHGVPGSLKNALDWLVSGAEMIDRPFAVVTASPLQVGGPYAHAQLRETLSTMSARVVADACREVAFVGNKVAVLDGVGVITDEAAREDLRNALTALLTSTD